MILNYLEVYNILEIASLCNLTLMQILFGPTNHNSKSCWKEAFKNR